MRIVPLQHTGGTVDAVFHQVFKGSDLQGALKTATAFTFAQMHGCCEILKSDRLVIVFFNIQDGLFYSGFIHGNGSFFAFIDVPGDHLFQEKSP